VTSGDRLRLEREKKKGQRAQAAMDRQHRNATNAGDMTDSALC
jgi:hypothetical protein